MGKVTELQKIKTHENIWQERSQKPLKTFKNILSAQSQAMATYWTPKYVTLLVVIRLQIRIGVRYGTKTFFQVQAHIKMQMGKVGDLQIMHTKTFIKSELHTYKIHTENSVYYLVTEVTAFYWF